MARRVKIPAGSTTGTKLRIKGFSVRADKGKDGNLYAVFEVATPKKWSKEDLELLEKMKLDDSDPLKNSFAERWFRVDFMRRAAKGALF